jgi:hypothetical protein
MDMKRPIFAGVEACRQPAPPPSPLFPNYFILIRYPTRTDWMKHRVDSRQGKEIYSHRMSVGEPVFGNIGSNKRLNRFSLRSKKKVQGQWQLYCLVHYIEKLTNYGQLAA